jgi:hypothetical protein
VLGMSLSGCRVVCDSHKMSVEALTDNCLHSFLFSRLVITVKSVVRFKSELIEMKTLVMV